MHRPHPSGEGRGVGLRSVLRIVGRWARTVVGGPTSLMRGERHPGGLFRVVEGMDGVARVMVVVKE